VTYSCLADLYRQETLPLAPILSAPCTRNDSGSDSHPFQPRQLTLQERRDEDLHVFHSPKEKRRVEVIGLSTLCLTLLHEFNPNIAAYTERPRVLLTASGRHELAFWIRDREGRERFLVIVPTSDSQPEQGGKRVHRRADAWLDAARIADIQLIFVFETDLMEQRVRIAQALRLLPYVQDIQRLPNRLYLQDRVMAFLELNCRVRFSQVEQSLSDFVASDVRAAVCDLVHQGTLTIDPSTPLTMRSVVSLRGRHA